MKAILSNNKLSVFIALIVILSGVNVRGDEIFDKAYRMMEQGKPVQALALYEKAIAANPNSADIWQEYTICLRKLKRYQKALQAGWRTIELGNESEGTWGNIGNVMMEAHAWDAAYGAFQKAAALAGNKTWAAQNFLNLGFEQWIFGENNGAKKSYDAASVLAPDYGPAMLDMGNLLASTGNPGKGKELMEKALGLLKKDNNKNGASYASMSLEFLKENGKIVPPDPKGKSYQNVPSDLLKRPPADSSIKLKIESAVKRVVRIGENLTLVISTPEEWLELTGDDKKSGIITVEFLSSPGKNRFHCLITPLPSGTDKKTNVDLKAITTSAGTKLLPESVEKNLNVFEFKGKQVNGYAYTLTDKSWKKGSKDEDYQYVTQGFFIASNVVHSFTILTDTSDVTFIADKIEAFKSISFVK
jgi:tetratricopeptide (TPR) repeat protein